MFLYKGVTFFGKEMVLNREYKGEALPMQFWSANMTWDAEEASFVRLYFASRLRSLLLKDNPRIPKVLLDFIRTMDIPGSLKVSHNWVDIIPYPISTMFRVYGFQGTPHVLPYQIPLKVGIAEMLCQIGRLEEEQLTGQSRGSIFLSCIVSHQFIVTKGGWLFLYKFLDPYKMIVSHDYFNDSEGFFDIFK